MQSNAFYCHRHTIFWKIMHYITITCNAKFIALEITSLRWKCGMHCNSFPLHSALPLLLGNLNVGIMAQEEKKELKSVKCSEKILVLSNSSLIQNHWIVLLCCVYNFSFIKHILFSLIEIWQINEKISLVGTQNGQLKELHSLKRYKVQLQ